MPKTSSPWRSSKYSMEVIPKRSGSAAQGVCGARVSTCTVSCCRSASSKLRPVSLAAHVCLAQLALDGRTQAHEVPFHHVVVSAGAHHLGRALLADRAR